MARKISSKSDKPRRSGYVSKRSKIYKSEAKSKPRTKPVKVVSIYKPDLTMETVSRRQIRYIIFRIQKGTVGTMDRDLRAVAEDVERAILKQLAKRGENWKGFTFTWDLDPKDTNPPTIVGPSKRDWVARGGGFEYKPSGLTERQWADLVLAQGMKVARRPAAFTKQE